jgi:hypothetical protein
MNRVRPIAIAMLTLAALPYQASGEPGSCSISSSARASSVGSTSSPSALGCLEIDYQFEL